MSSRPVLVIAGASGVVGRHLIAAARPHYDLRLLTRHASNAPTATGKDVTGKGVQAVVWNPQAAAQNDRAGVQRIAEALSGAHALVNLAGASIADGRLGEAHRQRVISSRVDSAHTLAQAYAHATAPPPVWFQASATGYYGDAGDTPLDEYAPQGTMILSDVCAAWEGAARGVEGARLVIGRIGVVLAQGAPAWQKLLWPIRLFVGGPFGRGEQWWAWIDADDLAQSILFLIGQDGCEGVYNLTAPAPERQKELVRKTATHLSRPALIAVPPLALRLILGRVADEVLLASARVLPTRLQQAGFRFDHPSLEQALPHWLA